MDQILESGHSSGRPLEAWVVRALQPEASGSPDPAPLRALGAEDLTLASGTLPQGRLLPALCLSLALHAAGLLAVAISWASNESGVIEQPSEAITVEVVESAALEAFEADDAIEAPAPSPVAATQEGNSDRDAAASAPPAERDPRHETMPAEEAPPLTEPVHEAERASAVAPQEAPDIDVQSPQQPSDAKQDDTRDQKASAEDRPEEITKPKKVEKERERTRAPARRGGPTAKSRAGSARSSARASASRGSILSYAARVRARVAGNKPPGGGHRGTAVIAFGVTPSGGLAYARVARSSGSASLDQAALSAVRRAAPFPDPPVGASAAALRFSISFHFQ